MATNGAMSKRVRNLILCMLIIPSQRRKPGAKLTFSTGLCSSD
jgi:hypothetical protein